MNSINYFRGIAIFLIVMAHSYGIAHWGKVYSNPNTFEKIFHSLNLNGSVFFVFISGYLYNHIFYPRFNYRKFLIKKAKFVLLPYLFCATLPILYTLFDHEKQWLFHSAFVNSGRGFLPPEMINHPWHAISWFLITGRFMYAYWFIPMIMLVFLLCPLINYLIKSDYLLKGILVLLPIAVIIHRPVHNINTLHSLIYFLPVYLLGIYSSIHRQKILAVLKDVRAKILLLCSGLGLCLVQVLVFNSMGNFNKSFFSITVPDVNLLQKIIFCFLLISILDSWEKTEIKILKKTAETSFAIYFIHPFLMRPLMQLTRVLGWNYQGNFFTLIIATVVLVACSMAIAWLIKLIFKKNSRYLIGW